MMKSPKKRKRKTNKKIVRNTFKTLSLKMAVLVIIASLNWISLSMIGQTFAFFNDEETSTSVFTAGILDFELSSPSDFTPTPLKAGESATRTISILNYGNNHKYTVSATNLSNEICDYLILEARLNNGDIIYSGLLKDFIDFGPTVFDDHADWFFTLTLPSDAPESILGQTCFADFVFSGSQTRNDLAFGTGFRDTEQISNSIKSVTCENIEMLSHGYWKNHSENYILPQFLGNNPEDIQITTPEEAYQILSSTSSDMRDLLKKQLLAMKFDIVYLGVGDYLVQSEGKTLNQLVEDADNLLRNPDATKDELEYIKNVLDSFFSADDGNPVYINYCHEVLPAPKLMMSSGAPTDDGPAFFSEEPMLMMTMLGGTPEEENNSEEPTEELGEEQNNEENIEEPEEQEEPQQTEENQEQMNEEPQEEPQLSAPQGDIITENNNEELPQEEPAKLPEENPEEPQQIEENNNTQETNSGGGETTSEPIIENNEVTE